MYFSKATFISLFLAGVNAQFPGAGEGAITRSGFHHSLPSGFPHHSGWPSGVAAPSGHHHKSHSKGRGKTRSHGSGASTQPAEQPSAGASDTASPAVSVTAPATTPETTPESSQGAEKRQEHEQFPGHQRHNSTGAHAPTRTGGFHSHSHVTGAPTGGAFKAGGCDSLVSAGVALSCATNKVPAHTASGSLASGPRRPVPLATSVARPVCYTTIRVSRHSVAHPHTATADASHTAIAAPLPPNGAHIAPCYKVSGQSEQTSVWSLASSLAPTPSAGPESSVAEGPTASASGDMSIQTSTA